MNTLAVDLGKTGCRVALWRGNACVVAEGRGAPGIADPNGVFAAEAAIMTVAVPLLRSVALDAAGVGTAGALTAPAAAGELARRLAARFGADVTVGSDALASHAGALRGEPGVVLALGTGAVAVAVGPDGVVHRVDGLGPWLGDAGSGAAIGRAGLRAALAAAEGRGAPTALLAAAQQQFGTLDDLPVRLGSDPARFCASFAPAVAACDDDVARAIMADATASLLATIETARNRLPPGAWSFALVGGLARYSALQAPIAAALPGLGLAEIAAPGTALDGARWLATARIAGVHRAQPPPRGADSLDLLATEAVRPGLEDLDQRPASAVVALSLGAERAAQDALALAGPSLGALADAVAARMAAGGRLFYLGAGTPGRLAVLDAAELAPTFSAPPGLVIPLLAGGPGAMLEAAEGAEDDAGAAAAALDANGLTEVDAVVGIAASGRTPFVVGGLAHARTRGALTGAIVNNAASPAAAAAEFAVEILTGPEIVAGSTRMTAGTTQKIALNALSTACMVALGKTYGSRMVDVRATNAKLRRRALRTVHEVAGCTDAQAEAALTAAGGRVKAALVMVLAGVDAGEAERRLAASAGRIRLALEG